MIFRFAFLGFAIVCLWQRAVEIQRNDRNLQGRRPTWTVIAITLIFLGFTLGSLVEVFVVERPQNFAISISGAILFGSGFILRRLVLRALGNLWAIDIDLKPDHHLVTTGPYRFCRHPNYLAMVLEMVGFCLVGNAFFTLLACLPLYVVAIAARIRLEEAALLEQLGDAYAAYMRTTFAVLPILRRIRNQSSRKSPADPIG